MAVGQGIRKSNVIKRQSGQGVPAIGAGGQILRRRTSVFQAPRDMYESDEMASHHQSTGGAYGLKHANGKLDGLLSAGTYKLAFEGLLEKQFVAGVSVAAVSMTIAGAGPQYTLTRGAGSYLTDGFKIGDVITLSVTGNAGNINKRLWIVGLTALVATVIVLNGTALVAEGPTAGMTVAVSGKKTFVPTTANTDEWFTIEEWYSDLARSELFPDMRISEIAVGLPASGNATISLSWVGIARTLAGTQQLTTPTAETSTGVMASLNGALVVNGVVQALVTGLQFTIGNGADDEGAVVGTNTSPGVARGRVRVSGQFTAKFDSSTLQTIYDTETSVALQSVIAADKTALTEFMAFTLGRIKLTGDTPDDGEKGVIRTYPFTAEINLAGGGAALAYDATIISVQDSAA